MAVVSPRNNMLDVLNYIDGVSIPATSRQWLENVEPATGQVYGRVPDSDVEDVELAVAAAERAYPSWSSLSPSERSTWLMRLAAEIDVHREQFARAECIDNGKPIALARAIDIPRAAANLRFFAGAILHDRLDAYQTHPTMINIAQRQPRGVAGCISPWNLPLYLFTWKIAPALATGNTVVGKPSELTPVTAYLMAQLCQSIGFPAGVLNIVNGLGPKVGAALVGHAKVSAISFTGGTETGRTIARTAGPLFKKTSLELGGKNANVVFADADLDRAVPTSVAAAFTNQGQICLCGSRLLVHRDIIEPFTRRFVERATTLRLGDPLDESTQQGALVSAAHRDKVECCLARARDEGAVVLLGGDRPSNLPARCCNGFFLSPTVLTNLDNACETNQEEIFGPVVTVQPFDDDDDALAKANGTRYGLAATIWTQDIDRAHHIASRIDAGVVWINCWLRRDLRTPFGGMKDSGVGREGGDEALRFFTEAKNVCIEHPKR
jgi:aminomuconate-semialdehyde/2-hydroxymuconate-6-semialdehyde dehydrogenase